MELTIEQALQQGIAAHKEGKLQEAERLYKVVLQAQPAHPDANHNLGIIAVSVNKVALALPLFKIALEANPKIEQFWLSYIDALIKENQLETAKAVLEQSSKVGLVGEKIDALKAYLKQIKQSVLPKSPEKKKSLTLKDKRKKIAENKQQKKQAKGKNAIGISQSQSQLNNLLEHYQSGNYVEAEKLAVLFTQKFPKHKLGWKVLGAIFVAAGRTSEALNANQVAVSLSPQDAEAQHNLGNTLKELGKLDEAEASFRQAIVLNPGYVSSYSNLGNTLQELGRLDEAEASYRQATTLKPDYAITHCNLGSTLKELGRLDEAETSFRQALVLKPDLVEAHNNLGVTLKGLGRFEEAEASFRQAIAIKPDLAESYSNLANTLQETARFEEAEVSCRQAIVLKPEYASAHSNLGNALKELGRADEAEASFRRAIALKPNFAGAHSNLGNTLQGLGKFEEALGSFRRAIALKPNFAEAYSNLSVAQYLNGDTDSSLDSMKKAMSIDPKFDTYELFYSVIQAKKSREETEVNAGNVSTLACRLKLTNKPLILSRLVERELITVLSEMNSMDINIPKDTRYGKGRCSSGFNLFGEDHSIIKTVAEALISIMMDSVKSNIYVADSFFNILSAGGGSTPHNHLNELDCDHGLCLGRQKYSLVYYLCVGDQDCNEPGTLKLFDPNEDILPYEGMIIIIPAGRIHSAVYGGKTDRVMIGVNFYSL